MAWKWFVRLAERGKDATKFASVLASYAARGVKNGRRLCRQENANDAMNPQAQQRHSFRVESLPSSTATSHENLYATPLGQQHQDEFEERLQENTVTPVPEQVAFRLDFPAWLQTLTGRERRIIRAMMRNERTTRSGQEFELSPARISQMRREFHLGWELFGEDSTDDGPQPRRRR